MPTRLRDLTNLTTGPLNASKNKNIIRYNATTGRFETITIDTLLGFSTNTPDSFVDIVEERLDAGNLQLEGVDGGTF